MSDDDRSRRGFLKGAGDIFGDRVDVALVDGRPTLVDLEDQTVQPLPRGEGRNEGGSRSHLPDLPFLPVRRVGERDILPLERLVSGSAAATGPKRDAS